MSPAKTFLKNYLPTARKVITQPRRFYQDMPVSGGFMEPLGFAVLSIFIISLLQTPIMLISWAPVLSLETDVVFTLIIMAAMFLYTLFSMLISLPVNAIIYHILLKILGAKGSLEATLRVFCYYLAIAFVVLPVVFIIALFIYLVEAAGLEGTGFDLLFIVILVSIMAPVLYSFYVLFVGFSEVHHISMKRVVLALVGIPTALFLLLMALMLGLIYITEYIVL